MTNLEFGSVVLVPFPFTDQTTSKRRPSVVISSQRYNSERPDVILMAITSRFRIESSIGEAVIVEWREAGLRAPSVIKPLIATIDQRMLVRVLGRLRDNDLAALGKALDEILR